MAFISKTIILLAMVAAATTGLSACSDAADRATDSATKMTADASVSVQSTGLVNVNTVSVEALSDITGVSDKISTTITQGRPFASMRALDDALDGAAVTKIAREVLYKRAYVPVAINTAPKADFMLIPGVGERMASQFDAYRPFADYAQFEREIGKHVQPREVARLRQYITIP